MTIKTKLRIIFTFIFSVMLFTSIFMNNTIKEIQSDILIINNQVLPARGYLFRAALSFKFLKVSLLRHITSDNATEMAELEKGIFEGEKKLVDLLAKYSNVSQDQSQDFVDLQYIVQKSGEIANKVLPLSRQADFTDPVKLEIFNKARQIVNEEFVPNADRGEKLLDEFIEQVTQKSDALNKQVNIVTAQSESDGIILVLLSLGVIIGVVIYSEKTMNNFQGTVQTIVVSLNKASQDLNDSANRMQVSVSAVNNESDRMSLASSQTANNVTAVAAAVEEMSAAIKDVSNQVMQTSTLIKESVNKANSANNSVELLKSAVKEVSNILEVIDGIAGQVNLLALNARIESARAGEAGKGFAVVAAEVKSLASQTSSATDTVTKQVDHIRSVSENVAQALMVIQSAISNVNNYSAGIASAVEEQSIATSEISSNMVSASQSAKNVSDGVNSIHKVTYEADVVSKSVLVSAQMLSAQAETLDVEMVKFLGRISNKKSA